MKIISSFMVVAVTFILFLVSSFSCDCDNGDENNAPQINIIQPMDGDIYNEGDTIAFSCDAYDAEDGDLGGESVIWTSTVDGEFGRDTVLIAVLNSGSHSIRAFATDTEGESTDDSVNVLVVSASAPDVVILSPTDGQNYSTGELLEFRCRATDSEDGNLSGESITWTSSLTGEIGTDTSFTLELDEAGTHTIRATAIDSDENTNWAEIDIEIVGIEELIPVGYLTTGGDAHDIDVEGDIAYLAAYEAGLFTIDVSDPSNPVELGNYRSDDGWAFRVDAQDNYAYLSDFHTFRIIDASSPSDLVSVYDYHPDDVELPWHQFFMEVFVQDTSVYISRHYYNMFNYPERLNITNPTEPVHHDAGIDQMANSIHIDSGRLYAVGFPMGHYVHERSEFIIKSLDGDGYVSDSLTNLRLLDISVSNDRAFVAANDNGLLAFDVTEIAPPVLLSSQLNNRTVLNVQVKGDYAFVACGWNGLKVLDISDPYGMTLIAEYRSTDYVRELHILENTLYVADGYNGLAIFDIAEYGE